MIELPLTALDPHPANSNVMPEPMLRKLTAAIERSGRYPPIVVRPVSPPDPPKEVADIDPDRVLGDGPTDRYQILDGHHRVACVKRLGHTSARCVVWAVDDDEALLLLATLNRLEGSDDPRKRARLLAQLQEQTRLDTGQLATLLPEDADKLDRVLSLNTLPAPQPPTPVDDLPVSVHFFLPRADKRQLDQKLKQIGGPREAALMSLVQQS